MILTSLQLKNFRQYSGTQQITFSTDPQKNVTVILGDNSFGKTTLLQAFSWCLYEKTNFDHPSELLNYDVQNNMMPGDTETVSVEVELIHSGLTYTITRAQKWYMSADKARGEKSVIKVSYTMQDGQTETVSAMKIPSVIHSILPEDLSKYFFFDTERVDSISESKDLARSVKGLLGLAPIDNAIDHLGSKTKKRSVLGKLYKELDEDSNERIAKSRKAMYDADDKIEDIKNRLEECEREIKHFEERKKECDIKIAQNKETAELQLNKLHFEESKKDAEDGLKSNTDAFWKKFNTEFRHFFSAPLCEKALDLLEKAEVSDKGIKDLTKATLEDIIANRNACICGCSLVDNPQAIEHIKSEMKYCPPESLGNAIRHYSEYLKSYSASFKNSYDGLESTYQNVLRFEKTVQETEEHIEFISRKIADAEDVRSFEAEARNAKEHLKDLHDKKDKMLQEKGAEEKTLENCKSIIEQESIKTQKNDETALYIRYAEQTLEWLEKIQAQKSEKTRVDLEVEVNKIFAQIYHGSRRVQIDDSYNVRLLTNSQSRAIETGESGGLNSVKNFAFIAGLTTLARDHITVSGSNEEEIDLSSEPYPLVMDAPFSKADNTHTANISKVLPEASEQVVMFVMNKDWEHARPVLTTRIGSSYVIEKNSETSSMLKEQ